MAGMWQPLIVFTGKWRHHSPAFSLLVFEVFIHNEMLLNLSQLQHKRHTSELVELQLLRLECSWQQKREKAEDFCK